MPVSRLHQELVTAKLCLSRSSVESLRKEFKKVSIGLVWVFAVLLTFNSQQSSSCVPVCSILTGSKYSPITRMIPAFFSSYPSLHLSAPPSTFRRSHIQPPKSERVSSRKRVGQSDLLQECRGERPSFLSTSEREREQNKWGGGGGKTEEEGLAIGERNRHGF